MSPGTALAIGLTYQKKIKRQTKQWIPKEKTYSIEHCLHPYCTGYIYDSQRQAILSSTLTPKLLIEGSSYVTKNQILQLVKAILVIVTL